MNCKPGDLAVIVKISNHIENLGKIVRVVRRATVGDVVDDHRLIESKYAVTWVVEGNVVKTLLDGRVVRKNATFLGDELLRPIRNPGDDAKDESLSWLPPVPNDISAEDPQDLREALKQWAEEQR